MKKIFALGVAAMLLIVLICIFYYLYHTPTSSKINNPAPDDVAKSEPSDEKLETGYFTSVLPSGYSVTEQHENGEIRELLQLVANKPTPRGQQIAITVDMLPKMGIDEVGNYSMRKKNPDLYFPIEFGGMPAGVPTFWNQSSDTYSIVGFWYTDSLYASIAVSGVVTEKQKINQDYMKILDSWQWH